MKIEKISKDEGYIEITGEEYQEDLASGLSEDEVLKPGRHKFIRGGFLKRHPNLDRSQTKTTIHIDLGLDQEMFEYFKRLAQETNADSYQTVIKQILRVAMEQGQQTKNVTALTQSDALLANPQFIEAVAERVKTTLAKKSATSRNHPKTRRRAA